jgi:hypothetical protein
VPVKTISTASSKRCGEACYFFDIGENNAISILIGHKKQSLFLKILTYCHKKSELEGGKYLNASKLVIMPKKGMEKFLVVFLYLVFG